ncbi:hypothetical protein [Vibrio vulnificus]|uniref:hypothetical protein n=1 Tax=Vibrio vulnificus TaxID=672 RepID=UPI004059E00C
MSAEAWFMRHSPLNAALCLQSNIGGYVIESIFCWFDGVFSTEDHKVQLIAIILSTLIALFVLFANQRLMKRTARNELMLSKYELAYNHTVQIDALVTKLCSSSENLNLGQTVNMEISLNTHAQELVGLTALYFPQIKFDSELIDKLLAQVRINRKLPKLCELDGLEQNIKGNLVSIKEFIFQEIKRYRH